MASSFEIMFEINPGDLAVNAAWEPARFGERAGIRKTKRHKDARAKLAEAAHLQNPGVQLEGPLAVVIVSYWARQHRQGPAIGLPLGDVDAPVKGILDALGEAGLFGDDAQVVQMHVEKRLSIVPRIYVAAQEIS